MPLFDLKVEILNREAGKFAKGYKGFLRVLRGFAVNLARMTKHQYDFKNTVTTERISGSVGEGGGYNRTNFEERHAGEEPKTGILERRKG